MDPEDLWWVAPAAGFLGVIVGSVLSWVATERAGKRAVAHSTKLADAAAAEARAATDRARQQEARARIYLDLLPLWAEKRPLGRGHAVLQQMRRLAWIAGDEDDLEVRALELTSNGGTVEGPKSDLEVEVQHTLWTNVGNRLKDLPERLALPPALLGDLIRPSRP